MKRFLRRFGWLFVLLLIAGCEQKAVDSRSRLASEPLPEKTDSVTDKPVLPSLDRKIIKEGEIHFETWDLDETRGRERDVGDRGERGTLVTKYTKSPESIGGRLHRSAPNRIPMPWPVRCEPVCIITEIADN